MSRRFIAKESTKSLSFLLPMLRLDRQKFLGLDLVDYIINVYISDVSKPEYTNHIFIQFEYHTNANTFARIEMYLQAHKEFVTQYEPDEFSTIFVFRIPDEFYLDYLIILDSKYSRISATLKKLIIGFFQMKTTYDIYKILFREESKRKELEEFFGVELSKDAELASIFNFEEKEIYSTKHNITNPLELSNDVWQV